MNLTNINPADIIESYSGKNGCICGCRGTYSKDSCTIKERWAEMLELCFHVTQHTDVYDQPYIFADLPNDRVVIFYFAKNTVLS